MPKIPEDTWTPKKCAQLAMDIQDASNPLPVVDALHKVLLSWRRHFSISNPSDCPPAVLILDKLNSLTKSWDIDTTAYVTNMEKCEVLANA